MEEAEGVSWDGVPHLEISLERWTLLERNPLEGVTLKRWEGGLPFGDVPMGEVAKGPPGGGFLRKGSALE